MTSPQLQAPPLPDRKPRDEEMDIYGLTHPGKVRKENQDHFLVCSLRKEVGGPPHQPRRDRRSHRGQRAGRLAHDGGGRRGRRSQGRGGEPDGAGGGDAIRLPLHGLLLRRDPSDDRDFFAALQDGGRSSVTPSCSGAARKTRTIRGMATTLTLYLGDWPRAYLLQVGDSRCYLLRGERADPDQPGPDHGAGADRRRASCGRPTPPGPVWSTPSPARSAGGRPRRWSPGSS